MIDGSYFKSLGAIFRMVAIVLGIIGLILLVESRDTGRYYNTDSGSSHESECHTQELNEIDRNLDIKYKTCPWGALTFTAKLLAGLGWVFTVILLVLKIGFNDSALQQLDFFGQIAAALGFGIAFLADAVFLVMVYLGNYPKCRMEVAKTEEIVNSKGRSHKSNSLVRQFYSSVRASEPKTEKEMLEVLRSQCNIQMELVFQEKYIIFGCIFVLAAAVFCFLAPIVEKKKGMAVGNYGRQGGQANSRGGIYGPPQFQTQSVVPPSKVEGVPIEKPSIENPKPED